MTSSWLMARGWCFILRHMTRDQPVLLLYSVTTIQYVLGEQVTLWWLAKKKCVEEKQTPKVSPKHFTTVPHSHNVGSQCAGVVMQQILCDVAVLYGSGKDVAFTAHVDFQLHTCSSTFCQQLCSGWCNTPRTCQDWSVDRAHSSPGTCDFFICSSCVLKACLMFAQSLFVSSSSPHCAQSPSLSWSLQVSVISPCGSLVGSLPGITCVLQLGVMSLAHEYINSRVDYIWAMIGNLPLHI